MYRYTLLILLLLLPVAGFAAPIIRTVAVVNDEIVTSYQLDRALATKVNGVEKTGEASKEMRRELLDKMVEELLLSQRINELQLTAAPEEVDAAINDILKQNNLSLDQLKAALLQQGLTFDTYRETLSKQILRYKLMGREVQAKVEVTKREIRRYFDEHVDDYQLPPKVRVDHLSLNGDDRVLIAALRTRLDSGESLITVLESYADDERIFGGEMGTFLDGELAPVFAAAIEELPVGGVSEIVAQGEMLHVLIVAEKIPGGVQPLEDVQGKIEAVLRDEKGQARFKEWITELKENAHIVIQLE